MAVSDHIQIAASELRRAAELVKQEIEDLRTQETQTKRDIDNQISDLMRDMGSLQSDIRRTDDPNQRDMIQQNIRSTELKIARLRAQENKMQRDIESAIRSKLGQVDKLESQSRGLAS